MLKPEAETTRPETDGHSGGSHEIWKMPATDGGGGEETVQLTRNGVFEMSVAPNGKEIIYSKRSDTKGLWSVSADGTNEKRIPELAQAGYWRSWHVANGGVY